ncbi:GNAT family N-acetyltransferase [Turneriella parva]|uniref:N-acetyltransferase domain-containing protein n=1 Tax=Turneriella parva (strain ATCC BAA-1111 / DSM 21527 / NCTC 11395 / H) TaxID=869212 RepID=I4B4R2_TURPD|nr:GNAT family N-acetyltransferase [Turneriella parva]AFM12269.1 hypothetical protein Turpa_1621 [Turneriella parva DSM 21527]
MQMDETSEYEPLTLTQYGIQLRRMTEADKEMVRVGRNKEFVRNNHVYREIISIEQHETWFREVSSPLHYILIIHYHDRDVGIVIVKDFLPDRMVPRCGAFIWDEDYIGTKVPILSILIALDFFFYNVGISGTESVVLKSNSAAIKMNQFFGFEFTERDSESYNITMDKKTYMANRDRLRAFACRAAKKREEQELKIGGTKSALNLPVINSLLPG